MGLATRISDDPTLEATKRAEEGTADVSVDLLEMNADRLTVYSGEPYHFGADDDFLSRHFAADPNERSEIEIELVSDFVFVGP